jgi:hypothetical protein
MPPRSRLSAVIIGLASTLALAAGTALSFTAQAGAATGATTSTALLFGIYPGGPAGGASGSNPDNVSNDLAAVKQLDSSDAPFMVHLYAEYYGPGSYTAAQEIGSEVQAFAKAGFQVELVLAYRPTDEIPATDVPGFASWTQATLASLGRYLTYLQVTNEANVSGNSSSNDGAYPGAESALIRGVEAAKSYITAHSQAIKVGFNWSYNASVSSKTFWSYLSSAGGSTFEKDVNWVGIDVYPGTWQSLPGSLSFSAAVSTVMSQAIHSTRSTYMPLAGLGAGVPIQITETGYPTGPGRTYAMQETALEAEVSAVVAARTADDVSAIQVFDLRDAITNSTIFEDQYGLMTDQWAPKPAFADYERLIAQDAAPTTATGSAANVRARVGKQTHRSRNARRGLRRRRLSGSARHQRLG